MLPWAGDTFRCGVIMAVGVTLLLPKRKIPQTGNPAGKSNQEKLCPLSAPYTPHAFPLFATGIVRVPSLVPHFQQVETLQLLFFFYPYYPSSINNIPCPDDKTLNFR